MKLSLATELQEFSKQFAEGTPKEVIDLLRIKAEELAKSGLVESSIKVGDKAPDFALPDAEGKAVHLAELLKKGPVVLTFYRGGWCPYCNIQVRSLQAYLPQFEAKGATLVAVSPELPEYIAKTTEENLLTYPILSDVGMKVGKQYSIQFVLDPEIQEMYTKFGLDVNSHNGDKTFQLPLPATYVIGQDGTVTYAFVNADYSKRAEPADILNALA